MAFCGMENLKTGQLTLGGQFDAYKRGQLERNIHLWGKDIQYSDHRHAMLDDRKPGYRNSDSLESTPDQQ